tara:strand:+ start:226 stop:708 length:483 start_codon:yes stop_codon:yes gene_type:complete
MMDAAIAASYMAIMLHQKDRLSVACFSAFAICALATVSWVPVNDPVMDYAFYFAIYSTLSLYSLNKNHLLLATSAAAIAFYDLFFAVDRLANHQEATFIWRHHEAFVLVLHAMLVCVLSQKLTTLLRGGWYNLCMLFNFRKACQFDTSSDRREKGKEVNQ